MATRNQNHPKCYACSTVIVEYFELICKHQLCTGCVDKYRSGDNFLCPGKHCIKSTKHPKKKRINTSSVKSVIARYEKQMVKGEEDCLKHIKKLEEEIKTLRKDEKKHMDEITCLFNKRTKQLEDHYDGIKRKANDCFRKREGQPEKILNDIKDILGNIRDEMRELHIAIRSSREYQEKHIGSHEVENMKKKASVYASQTMEVDIPAFHITMHASEDLDIRDSIEIAAPLPEFRIHNNVPHLPALDVANSQPSRTDDTGEVFDTSLDCQSYHIDAPPPCPREINSKENKTDRNSAELDISSIHRDDNIDVRPDGSTDALEVDLEWASRIQWVRTDVSVKLSNDPVRLRLMRNNELWQCHGRGITVIDAGLRPLRQIERESDNGDMGRVFDVAGLSDGDAAVAAYHGLFLISDDGKKRRRIAKSYFTGVAEQDGRLYAAEYKGNIRVYEHVDGWKECHGIDLGCGAQMITISIQNAMIYVCLCKDSKFVAYSLSGTKLGAWGSEGCEEAGDLDEPYLCMVGTGGAALIADTSSYRLQVLSADRQWSVVSLQPPVWRPMSALLYQDRLIVASAKDDTLYLYKTSGDYR